MGWRDRLALALAEECADANSASSADSSPERGGGVAIGTTGATGIGVETPKRAEAVPLAAALGTPAKWASGVAQLAITPPPTGITPARWGVFQADAIRLLAEHGSALADAGWDALDVFGLHRWAPFTRYDAAGLAWLAHGRLLGGITAEAATLIAPAGHTLACRRMGQKARAEAVLAWEVVRVCGARSQTAPRPASVGR